MSFSPQKIVFPLDPGDAASAELLWGIERDGGTFELDSIPALAYDVNLGDIVRTERREDGRLYFTQTVMRGGHRTFRVSVAGEDSGVSESLVRDLERIGCKSERSNSSYIAIDAPNESAASKLADLLENGLQRGLWDYEESGASDVCPPA